MDLKQKIIRNTIYNSAGFFVKTIISLLLIPYIVRTIGLQRFGIFAIVGVLAGYFGLLDFGFHTGFSRFISFFYAKNEYRKISQVVNTGILFYFIFGAIIIILGTSIIPLLIKVFRIPQELVVETNFAIKLGIITFAITGVFRAVLSVLIGLQRMDVFNKIEIFTSFLNAILIFILLELGFGLKGLVFSYFITSIINGIISLFFSLNILPQLKFGFTMVSKEIFKQLFNYGCNLQITVLSSLAGPATNKFLISIFMGMPFVGAYEIGHLIVTKVRGLIGLLSSALMPAFSELSARDDLNRIKLLYLNSFKYVFLFGLLLTLFFFFNSDLIILTWMKKKIYEASIALKILILGFFVISLTEPGANFLHGVGKPQYHMRVSAASFFLSLFLSIMLMLKYGFVGIVTGTSLAYIFLGILFVVMVNRILKISLGYLSFFVLPIAVCVMGLIVGDMTADAILPRYFFLTANRLLNGFVLLLRFSVTCLIYIGLLFFAKYFFPKIKL